MIEQLFTALTTWLYGAPLIAFAAAAAWGVISILFSPCHLGSLPLVIAFLNGQEKTTLRRSFVLALCFALGVLLTIAIIGGAAAMLGRMLGDVGRLPSWIVGGILIGSGIIMLDLFTIPFLNGLDLSRFMKRGKLAAVIIGLFFGLALGPCTFAFMAPVLGVVFSTAATHPLFSAGLLAAYAGGHLLVIALIGTFFGVVSRRLSGRSRTAQVVVKRLLAVLVIVTGGLIIYNNL